MFISYLQPSHLDAMDKALGLTKGYLSTLQDIIDRQDAGRGFEFPAWENDAQKLEIMHDARTAASKGEDFWDWYQSGELGGREMEEFTGACMAVKWCFDMEIKALGLEPVDTEAPAFEECVWDLRGGNGCELDPSHLRQLIAAFEDAA